MEREPKRHTKRTVVLLILLALVCVGGVELAVCRVAAPELFRTLTAPVISFVRQAVGTGRQLVSQAAGAVEAWIPEPTPSEPPVDQLASDPTIDEVPPAEDPAITEFVERDGQEWLTGGVVEITYFNQGEEPWASQRYGPDPIAGYGCGPTALAMAVSSLTGETVDPAEMAAWASEQGYCAPGSGSYLGIVEGTAAAYGLEIREEAVPTAEELCQALASGHIYVALMTKGHFTNSGHFILLRGVTLEGEVLVADPNSRERSLAAWDPQLILDELSPSRSGGAPLWQFSTLGARP